MTLRLVKSSGTRIQFAVFNVLMAEVIVQNDRIADTTWAKWANLRYKRKEPMGCCSISRADMPRLWDVPVGSIIPPSTKKI